MSRVDQPAGGHESGRLPGIIFILRHRLRKATFCPMMRRIRSCRSMLGAKAMIENIITDWGNRNSVRPRCSDISTRSERMNRGRSVRTRRAFRQSRPIAMSPQRAELPSLGIPHAGWYRGQGLHPYHRSAHGHIAAIAFRI